MTQKTHRKHRKRSLGQALAIGCLAPVFSLGSWYLLSMFLYQIQQYISNHHQIYARHAYVGLSGLLYSTLFLAIILPLWVWWQLLGRRRLNWWHWKNLLPALLLISSVGYYFSQEAITQVKTAPKIIAHRALNGDNGVENTLEAFRKTSKFKPDFIEIDVYETADGQFVSYHDSTLKKAGRSEHPHDLTLAELTKLTVTDPQTGKTGQIPSFDDLFNEAENLGQKLLIDFKTTKADSSDMVDRFLRKYQKRIESSHHQVQSFDATFMKKILSHKPKFETFLITSVVPDTNLSGLTGYSIQLSTLRDDLFMDLVEKNQIVYVWTVNDEESVSEAEYLAVDGIITDVMTDTKQNLENIQIYRDYVSLFYERLYYLHLIN